MKNHYLHLFFLMIFALPLTAKAITNDKVNSEDLNSDKVYGKFILTSILNSYQDSEPIYDYGIYTFPLQTENNITQLTKERESESSVGYFDGVLIDDTYVLSTFFSEKEEGRSSYFLHFFDANTLQFLNYIDPGNIRFGTLAYDTMEKILYGIHQSDENEYSLRQIDYQNHKNIEITPISLEIISGTFDTKGQLYVIDKEANLYKMNKLTGSMTLIGETGVTIEGNDYAGFCYDEDTDKFYWAANLEKTSGLYEVNINTGKATLLQQFPNREKLAGMVPIERVHPNAPATVKDLNFHPTFEGELQGRIQFTVPDKTEGNEELNENLSGTLYVSNGVEIKLENLVPGSSYTSQQIIVDKEGMVVYKIVLKNQAGQGRTIIKRKWLGIDIPATVSNLNLSKDNDGSPLINWTRVTTGQHEGYIEPTSLRYKIIRYPDSKIVATELTETTYKDKNIEGDMQLYSYGVIAYYPEKEGREIKTQEMLFGSPILPPFNYKMSTETHNHWSILDANGDGKTWAYDLFTETMESPYLGQDDWLFSPALQLEPGAVYKIKFLMTTPTSIHGNDFSITYGNQPHPEFQKTLQTYSNYINYRTNNPTFSEVTLMLGNDEGGVIYIGFHCYSPVTSYGILEFQEFSIELAALPESPGMVTNLTITYSEEGSKPASLSFLAPTKNTIGDELTSLEKIEIYRNDFDKPVYTINDNKPGQSINWKDEEVNEGSNHYHIIAINESGAGLIAKDSVFIGLDLPKAVRNLHLIRNDQDNAQLSWEAPLEGIHKGYIKDVIYKIKKNGNEVVGSHTETSYTDHEVSKTQQTLLSYTIIPFYEDQTNNEGQIAESNTVRFGPVYTLPYEESFAGTKETKTGWSKEYSTPGSFEWSFSNKLSYCSPQDEDGGMAVWYAEEVFPRNSQGRLITPMLDLSSTDLPLLRFWFYHYEMNIGDDDHINLLISLDEGKTFTTIQDTDPIYFQPSLNKEEVTNGWKLYEIPLTAYKGEKKVLITFETTSSYDLAIDNLSVTESPEKDLKIINFEAPSRIMASYDNKFKVNIKNSGTKEATEYTIKLYKDDEVISTINGEKLISGDNREFTLTSSFDIAEIGKKYNLHVEVEYLGEELEVDNVSRIYSATVERSGYAGIPYMEGYYDKEKVFLDWDAPTSPKTPLLVEEGFEEYEPFIIDNIGEWSLIDGDRHATVNFGQNIFGYWNYPNAGEPMAYQVFNADRSLPNPELIISWDARTGRQCLISFPHTQSGPSDDWLISPQLNGSSQEIVFFARGANPETMDRERFVFYYSMNGNSRTDFIKMTENDFLEAATSWKEYRYILPEGAKYFAIQCVSEAAYSFLIDDISFLKAGEDITPIGYNIYRNENKLNPDLITDTQYIAPAPVDGEKNLYTVTAVYEKGESNQSDPFTVDFTNISTETIDQVKIYSEQGKINIVGARNMEITIMTVEGQLMYKIIGKGDDKFTVNAGAYIIKTENKASKIIVR